MRPKFNEQTCHDLAVAFAKEHYKPQFISSTVPTDKQKELEDNLGQFEGLYILAYQFFSRDREG